MMTDNPIEDRPDKVRDELCEITATMSPGERTDYFRRLAIRALEENHISVERISSPYAAITRGSPPAPSFFAFAVKNSSPLFFSNPGF
jgi:hypothetical protein